MAGFHDFPRLASESGFLFPTKPSKLDWKAIEQLDVDAIVSGRQFTELERSLDLVLTCDLDSDTVKFLDRNFVKLFRVSQLGIAYLSHCLTCLDRCVVILQEQLNATQQDHKQNTVKRHASMHKCKHCDKTFITDSYLSSHVRRRHSPSTTVSSTQTPLRCTDNRGAQTEEIDVVNAGSQTVSPDVLSAATQTDEEHRAVSNTTNGDQPSESAPLQVVLDKFVEEMKSRLPGDWLTALENRPLFVPFVANCCHQIAAVQPPVGETQMPVAAPRSSVPASKLKVSSPGKQLRKQETIKTVYLTSESEDELPITRLAFKQIPTVSEESLSRKDSVGPTAPQNETEEVLEDWPSDIEINQEAVSRIRSVGGKERRAGSGGISGDAQEFGRKERVFSRVESGVGEDKRCDEVDRRVRSVREAGGSNESRAVIRDPRDVKRKERPIGRVGGSVDGVGRSVGVDRRVGSVNQEVEGKERVVSRVAIGDVQELERMRRMIGVGSEEDERRDEGDRRVRNSFAKEVETTAKVIIDSAMRGSERDISSIFSGDSDSDNIKIVKPPPRTRLAFSEPKPVAASSPQHSPVTALKEIGRPAAKPRRTSLLSAMKKRPPKMLGLVRRSLTSLYSAVTTPAANPGDLATRLRELHVDPTWTGIPDATLKKSLDALAHNRRLLTKKYSNMPVVRERIEEMVEQRLETQISSASPPASPRRKIEDVIEERLQAYNSPHTRNTAIHMYDVESDSSDLPPSEPDAEPATGASVVDLQAQKDVMGQHEQSKGSKRVIESPRIKSSQSASMMETLKDKMASSIQKSANQPGIMEEKRAPGVGLHEIVERKAAVQAVDTFKEKMASSIKKSTNQYETGQEKRANAAGQHDTVEIKAQTIVMETIRNKTPSSLKTSLNQHGAVEEKSATGMVGVAGPSKGKMAMNEAEPTDGIWPIRLLDEAVDREPLTQLGAMAESALDKMASGQQGDVQAKEGTRVGSAVTESRPVPILKKPVPPPAETSSDEFSPVLAARLEAKKVMLGDVKKVMFADTLLETSSSSSEWDLTAP